MDRRRWAGLRIILTGGGAAALLAAAPATLAAGPPGFIENRGQWPDPVRYFQQDSGVALYFTPGAIVMVQGGCALYVRFAGADPSPAIEPDSPLAARYHYFRGTDRANWRADVPAFCAITYRGLWPGIEVRFRLTGEGLQYDLTCDAGADPSAVQFRYDGPEEIAARITHSRSPRGGVFGWTDSGSALLDVPGALTWSTFLGGSSSFEFGAGVALDPNGNAIMVGYSAPPDFPTTPGVYDPSHNGGVEVVVSRLSASGNALLWSTILGGSGHDYGSALVLDAAGNAIVTGFTTSPDFPVTLGAYDTSFDGGGGDNDAFVAKLSSSGSALLWSTFLGGSGADHGRAVARAATGDVIVAGTTGSADFPATPGAYDFTANGARDAFLARLAPSGSALLAATYLGGSGDDDAQAVTVNPSGDLLFAGATSSPDFPATAGAHDNSWNGGLDGFVARMPSSAASLLHSTYLGGSADDEARGLALIGAGEVAVAGYTASSDFPVTAGAYDASHNGNSDAFVARLPFSSGPLTWSTFLGGGGGDFANALALDASGDLVVAGYTESGDFPTTSGAYDTSWNGFFDLFVARLSGNGAELPSSSFIGGSGVDLASAVALDAAGGAVLTGKAGAADFPATPGAYDTSYNGGSSDIIVARYRETATSVAAAIRSAEATRLVRFLNPCATGATFEFALQGETMVGLRLFDVRGRAVATLADGILSPGPHVLAWSGHGDGGHTLAPGAYFLRFQTREQTEVQRVILAR